MANMCSMKFCQSNGRYDKVRSFHGFPQDEERCKAWVEACGRPELLERGVEYLYKYAHVCDLHFKPSDRKGKRLLRPRTVPFSYDKSPLETKSTQTDTVLHCESDSDMDVDNDPGTSTATNISKKSTGNRTRASQLKRLQEKLRHFQEDKLPLGSELFKLIDTQIELQKRNKVAGCMEKLRLFALKLYLSSPTTYKVVRCAFSLPVEKVLRRTNLEIDAVMSNPVINHLQFKVSSLMELDRYCTACLRKMPLKRFLFYHINRDKVIGFRNINGVEIMEPATVVYVLMARGLNAKWEQPLAYCFLGENDDASKIDPWLDSVLNTIIGIGYNVVALVVDHEDLYDHFRSRIFSLAQPFFTLNVNQRLKKIYCIFDLPQLIISLRNTLMTHELLFQDDDGSKLMANWGTIEALYCGNRSDESRILVTKLTESHIRPNESEKKVLKYAAEVFSKSVSETLEAESKRRVDDDFKIRGTQKLTALVNDVFDILNSSAYNHHNKCKNAFTGEPYQMRAIRQFMEFLTKVKPLDDIADSSFNCIYGLRISIMSFSIILRDLLPKGIKSLVTHRFNLDAVDRFLDSLKWKSKSEKPTAVQFFKHFRQKFIIELMRLPKTISLADNLLHFINKIDLKQLSLSKLKSDNFKKTIEVDTVDYRFELPTSDSFHYMCWYLLKKCYKVHNNSTCELLSKMLHEKVLTVAWKYYNWDSYFKPPDVFIDYIKILDEEFNACFGHKMELGLGTGILLILRELRFFSVCSCFPVNYLRRLFVRLRIFNIIRYNNRRLRDESFRFSTTDYYNIDIL